MIFPLVILGAYKVLKGEKPYVLIFSTLYALMSQFYMYAYVAFGFEIFVLVRSYAGDGFKKYVGKVFKCNLFFLLGTLLGAFILFSQLYAVMNNGRGSGNSLVWYDLLYYSSLIFSAFIPMNGRAYSVLIGNFFAVVIVIVFFIGIKK